MIGGVGVDVVHIPGFREQLADPASSFVGATFTAGERQTCEGRPQPVASYAARFAAKEALIKAWAGARQGQVPELKHVDMREVEVVQDTQGRPTLAVHGAVAAGMAKTVPGFRLHVSLSHDGDHATAFVVLEY